MESLGRSKVYGSLGDVDLTTVSIPSGRTIDTVDSEYNLKTYFTSDTTGPNAIQLASGNYAIPVNTGAQTMFKINSIETVEIGNDTNVTITPPSGGRVSITYMAAVMQNPSFSVEVGGSPLIASGTKTLITPDNNVSNANQFKVGVTQGGGTVNRLTFGVDEAVVVNRGGGADIFLSYITESPVS